MIKRLAGLILAISSATAFAAKAAPTRAPASKRAPTAFELKNSTCRLEYKQNANAKWKPFTGKIPTGTKVNGFKSGSDVFTFRSAKTKDQLFRGSMACLKGEKKSTTSKVRVETPTTPYVHVNDSGIRFGIAFWRTQVEMVSTDASYPNEDIATQNLGVSAAYSRQFWTESRQSAGVEGIATLGLASFTNVDTTPSTEFSGKGIIAAVEARPFYYYRTSRMFGVGPLVALNAQYGIYGSSEDGAIDNPLTIAMVTGVSLKFTEAGHTINLGVRNFNFSHLHAEILYHF